MLSCVGGGRHRRGAVLPALARALHRDQFVRYGTLVHALLSTSWSLAVPEVWVGAAGDGDAGMAWISVANSLTVSAQMAMPDWVRARGMSIYQMALMGGAAAGSALWGQVAGLHRRAQPSWRRRPSACWCC
jgi:MFS family permease